MVSELKILLASSSPRRIELMGILGVDFEHISPHVEEDRDSDDPVVRVEVNSLRKAGSVDRNPGSLIIGADTVVHLDGVILGKPMDKDDAMNMLLSLSGRSHQVYTGVSIIDSESGRSLTRHEVTEVCFKELSEDVVMEYIVSGEPLDKAGAYGIQGLGGGLVDRVAGSYSNVVGLPLELLTSMLAEFGVTAERN